MKSRVHNSPNLIYLMGTQVVALKQVQGSNGEAVHPAGAVGVVVLSPRDRNHSYRIRFPDGFEAPLHHDNLMLLAEYKQGAINDSNKTEFGLYDPISEVARSRRFLPHWFQPGAATFVTFRTAGSMPQVVIERWRREQEEWLDRHGLQKSAIDDATRLRNMPRSLQNEFRRLRDRAWHKALPESQESVLAERALRLFDSQRDPIRVSAAIHSRQSKEGEPASGRVPIGQP